MEIEIKDIPSYVEKYDDLSEDQKSELANEGEALIKAETKDWTEASLTNIDFLGALTVNPKDTGYSYDSNSMYLIYELTATEDIPENDYKFDFTYLTYVSVRDVINNLDSLEYGEMESSSSPLYHKVDRKETGYSKIGYKGHYFLDQILDKIKEAYAEDSYNIEEYYTKDLDEYRLNTAGVAGDYISDQGSFMRLSENGKVELFQNSSNLYTGSWSNKDTDIEFKFIGSSGGSSGDGIFEGIITDSGKIRVPRLGWSGEVFSKREY